MHQGTPKQPRHGKYKPRPRPRGLDNEAGGQGPELKLQAQGQAGDQISMLEVPELGQEEGGWVDHCRSDRRGKQLWEPQVPQRTMRHHMRC